MMKSTRDILLLGLLSSLLCVVLFASEDHEEVLVTVYEGPTACSDVDRVRTADRVGLHYDGTIDASSATGVPGAEFDSTRDRGVFEFTAGVGGQVIDGWDEGVLGLCRGAKAILVVPPAKAYGPSGAGDAIPGGATLRFRVEVVSVSAPPPVPNLFLELDADRNHVLTPEEIHAHFRRADPDADMPPDLMAREDANHDGVVSREEFGGPRMPRDWCNEMLFHHAEPTPLGLAVRWLCWRPELGGRHQSGREREL